MPPNEGLKTAGRLGARGSFPRRFVVWPVDQLPVPRFRDEARSLTDVGADEHARPASRRSPSRRIALSFLDASGGQQAADPERPR